MYVKIAIRVAINAVYVLGALLLFAGFGPPVPLPGNPSSQRIVDVDVPRPSLPLEGPLAPNNKLQAATLVLDGAFQTSESLLVEPDGSLLLMDKYGYVLRATPDSSAPGGYALIPNPITRLGLGRPMGFRKHPATGHLITAVPGMGLVEVRLPDAATGTPAEVVLLTSYVSKTSKLDPDTAIQFANGVDITGDGSVIYFTDSSAVPVGRNYGRAKRAKAWFDIMETFLQSFCSGQQTGRLLAYYPNNRTTVVLLKGFWYGNGVVLAPDESYLLVGDTGTYTLVQHWLSGPKAGTSGIFIEGLPGLPDSITRAVGGKGYWVALPAPRTKILDMAARVRLIRVVLAYLPPQWRPPLQTWGAVVLVSPEGQVVRWLQDPTGTHVDQVSHAEEVPLPDGGTRLWLASVNLPKLAYLDL